MKYPIAKAVKSNKNLPYKKQNLTRLEKELIKTRTRLQVIIEEKDTINEELMAANEEIQSSNEELQSTNEELQTSQEELQSTNEELLTVNDELHNKNTQLTQLNSDLANILTSVNIPLIIVKNDLCIARFTPMARKVMNLIPSDVGRPIGDIKLNINIPDLEKKILDVIETMIPAELEITDETNRWHSVRIRPYKTTDNKIDGAVISLIDIDVIKRAQNETKDALDYATSIIETMREPLLILDDKLCVLSANKSFHRMFKVSAQEIKDKSLYKICGNEWNVLQLRNVLKTVLSEKKHFEDLQIDIDFTNIGEKALSLNARQIYLHGKKQQMILLAIEDVTQYNKAKEVLRRDEKALKTLVKEQANSLIDAQKKELSTKRLSDIGVLAATVAHELRNPLAAIGMAVHNIKKKANNPAINNNLANIDKKILESDQIINNLLLYSRIKPPHNEDVHILNLIEESLDTLTGRGKKDAAIVKDINSLKDVSIKADSTQIKEVINNILNNAYDAIPSSSGRIGIAGTRKNKSIKITITDNGQGIDKEDITKIFDPFFTTKAKGTGLGLTVCQQIINLHGGVINIQSELGKGTTVIIQLPRKRMHDHPTIINN